MARAWQTSRIRPGRSVVTCSVSIAFQAPPRLSRLIAQLALSVVKAGEPGEAHLGADVRLLGPAEIRQLAWRIGVRPAKRLGQNFVIDPGTVRRVARLARIDAVDVVVEVGPGFGSLTLALLPLAARVIAVEVDPLLAAELPRTVAERAGGLVARLQVLSADALALSGLPGPQPAVLVANLPYNVAVPVVLHLLEVLPSLRRGLVMVQAEVADRMTARPGSRVYGVPSVKLAWFADARRAGIVPRSVFWPVPNVDSALVAFTRRPPPAQPVSAGGARRVPSRAEVFAVVDAAFSQRRKTLRAALARWAGSPAAAEQVISDAGLDPGMRGEQLGVAEFARIAAAAAGR
jgi:16S rRNA (adenine1518-N6/adenine1519-N6)-dimethyltransferase